MKILLVCSAGMSTSLLENAIIKYAQSANEKVDVIAKPSNEAREVLHEYDVILLGPQVRFMESSFKQAANGKPVIVIPPQIYATAKGEECFKLAKDALK